MKKILLLTIISILYGCQLDEDKPSTGGDSSQKKGLAYSPQNSNKNQYYHQNDKQVPYQQHTYHPSAARNMNFEGAEAILKNGNTAYQYTPQAKNSGDLYAIEAAAVPVGYGCSDRTITGGGQEIYLKPVNMTTSAKRLEAKRMQYDPIVKFASVTHGVDPIFIHGIISQESAYQPKIEGPMTKYGTAKGMMQILDGTGKDMGVPNAQDLFIAEINVNAGTRYLRWLLNKFNGNATLAAASYNAGHGNIMKCGNRISPYANGQTLDYVQKVMGYANAIYRTQANMPQQNHNTGSY